MSTPPSLEPDAHVVSVIDLLLTVGYVDGLLHADEQKFIHGYIGWLIDNFAQTPEAADVWRTRIGEIYAALDAEIAGLVAEVTAADDDAYLRTRLKVRATALFRGFKPEERDGALQLLDQMMRTDGTVASQERELLDELTAYFQVAPLAVPPPTPGDSLTGMRVLAGEPPLDMSVTPMPLLDALEHPYATDARQLDAQLRRDYDSIFAAIAHWEQKRAQGNDRLAGVATADALPAGARYLDRHVQVYAPTRPTELVILGDLHGCYGTLKAAVAQARFFEKLDKFRRDPTAHAEPILIFLGDYIDRGRFSMEGVLRAALALFNAYPDNVVLLRGNHEFLVRMNDTIVSGVNPAEAMPALSAIAPAHLLAAYRHLFEHMPTSFICDRTLFVHGGIPREMTMTTWTGLAYLNDPVVKFEMMWGDPVDTDLVPDELQKQTPRFNFGREQFRAFMQRIGCHTLVRGHEQVDAGFHTMFDVGGVRLHTLFSSGGKDNADLPETSRYRNVTPHALTIHAGTATPRAVPWAVNYRPYITPAYNGFYR